MLVFVIAVRATAQADSIPDAEPLTYVLFAEDAGRDTAQADSIFFVRALPIVFPVSQSVVADDNPALLDFINRALPLLSDDRIADARIRVRSASSPEGPLWLNKELSRGRRDALLRIFRQYGVEPAALQIDVVDEEYELLAFFMRQAGDPEADRVTRLVRQYSHDPVRLKELLQFQDGGALWERLLRDYFPQLRASRFIIVLPETSREEAGNLRLGDARPQPLPAGQPSGSFLPPGSPVDLGVDAVPEPAARVPRRELLSVKTNLLEWGAYVPQYGWCPMPNIELEYYPSRGHWTFGGTFDFPWWIGSPANHKYFELRNYQLYARYYLRNSKRSYSDFARRIPAYGKAAFRGFYLEAYAGAFLYQIGFSATKGWIGEGAGGGLGLGYVLPVSRNGHWRLNFGLQVGMFYTAYDPFVWGCPVENVEDGLYYYDWKADGSLFKERQHNMTWIGPTRVSVSLSYDLLYRRAGGKRGLSFRNSRKGGAR